MSLETATFISDLSAFNPTSTDLRSQGDDHLRLLKNVLQTTFPNATRAFYFPRAAAKTSNYNVLAVDQEKLLTGDATGGAFSFTLPTLTSGDDGWSTRIMKIDSSANALTVAGTINGVTNFLVTKQYSVQRFTWSGTSWYVEADDVVRALRTVTPGKLIGLRSGGSAAQFEEISLATGITLTGGTLAVAPSYPRGYIDGFKFVNGTDAVNDVNIGGGVCRDYSNTYNIDAAALAGKQLDANFAFGANVGCRCSLAGLADGTYHYFVGSKADGTTDYYADTTADEATALAHWQAEPASGASSIIAIRNIMALVRTGNTIRPFKNNRGGEIEYDQPFLGFTQPTPGTAMLTKTMNYVPTGIKVLVWQVTSQKGSDDQIYVHSTDQTDQQPDPNAPPLYSAGSSLFGSSAQEKEIWTNTAAQACWRSNDGSNTINCVINKYWHPRGQNT